MLQVKVAIRLVVVDADTQHGLQCAVEQLDKPVRLRVVCGIPGMLYS